MLYWRFWQLHSWQIQVYSSVFLSFIPPSSSSPSFSFSSTSSSSSSFPFSFYNAILWKRQLQERNTYFGSIIPDLVERTTLLQHWEEWHFFPWVVHTWDRALVTGSQKLLSQHKCLASPYYIQFVLIFQRSSFQTFEVKSKEKDQCRG